MALHDGHPVELQLLYPDLGVEEPIAAVSGRYDLDRGALEAAARSEILRGRDDDLAGVRREDRRGDPVLRD